MKPFTEQRPIHHRYLMNGQPKSCAFCSNQLQGEVWRSGELYYCTEYCIDLAAEHKRRAN